jgi:N-acetylglucosaminyl-diphospho-decaprenol L-rhamnosyltransferase
VVSVVIPSLRGDDVLVELVAQLRRGALEAQVLIADNGLSSRVVDRLQGADAEVISMNGNRGFAAAVNAAAQRADADILVVLNDDLRVDAGFLPALVAPVLAGATMSAGVLLEATRPHVIETAGLEIDRTLGAHDYLGGRPISVLDRGGQPPLAPCGAAAAYAMDAFRRVGGFDEGFFAYYEDLDLALRLRRHGASCALATEARALHAGSATVGAGSIEKALLVGFSRGYLIRKYGVVSKRHTRAAVLAVAQETAASVLLALRHRSLAPAKERIRGWRACRVRADRPPEDALTVGVCQAWLRRYSRAHAAGARVQRPAA